MDKASKTSTCPFNPAHVIINARMAKHIEVCRRQYPKSPLKQCAYNSIHFYHPRDEEEHLASCKTYQALASLQMYQPAAPGLQQPQQPTAQPQKNLSQDDEDDWDTPVDRSRRAYVELKDELNSKKNIFMLPKSNMTKTEKRLFYGEQARRAQEFSNNGN